MLSSIDELLREVDKNLINELTDKFVKTYNLQDLSKSELNNLVIEIERTYNLTKILRILTRYVPHIILTGGYAINWVYEVKYPRFTHNLDLIVVNMSINDILDILQDINSKLIDSDLAKQICCGNRCFSLNVLKVHEVSRSTIHVKYPKLCIKCGEDLHRYAYRVLGKSLNFEFLKHIKEKLNFMPKVDEYKIRIMICNQEVPTRKLQVKNVFTEDVFDVFVEDIQDIVHDKIETLIKHVDNPYVVTRDLIDLRVLVLHKDKLNIDLIKNLVKYRVSKNILSQLLNTFTIKGLDYLLKSPMFIVARKMENKYLASVIYNLINIYQN